MSALRKLTDPLTTFNFDVVLVESANSVGAALSAVSSLSIRGFSECSGLDVSLEVLEYKEGGVNDFIHKFPGRASYPNLVLRHGIIPLDDQLWRWMQEILQGKASRRDGVLVLRGTDNLPVKAWTFKRGLPLKWVGPVLNASQNSVAIEAVEISHEGLSMPTALPF